MSDVVIRSIKDKVHGPSDLGRGEMAAVAAECIRYANMRYDEREGDRSALLTAVLRAAAKHLIAASTISEETPMVEMDPRYIVLPGEGWPLG